MYEGLSLPFPGGNVPPWKKTEKNVEYIWPIIIKFNQIDHIVSVHLMQVTDELGNVGRGQNTQKF